MSKNLALPEQRMDDTACKLVAEFFSLYANPTRISILCALSRGRKTVSELAEYAGVSLQNISQHLRIMRDKSAVRTEKDGRCVYYTISDPEFLVGIKTIRDALMKQLYERADAVRAPYGSADTAAVEASALNE